MNKPQNSYVPRQTGRRLMRRTLSAFIVITFFLLGYNSMAAKTQSCSAQYSIAPPIPGVPLPPALPGVCACATPCVPVGMSAGLATGVAAAYEAELRISSMAVENYIGMAVDTLVQTVFSRLERFEQDLVDWFDTYYYYNLRPSMQAAVEQANVAATDQAQQEAAVADAEQTTRAAIEQQEEAARSAIGVSDIAGNEACAVTTTAGGLGNANAYSRAIRRSLQNDAIAVALNRRGSKAARGPAAMTAQHAQEFETLFCNPSDNGGRNTCGASDPEYYNADVQVTGRIFNKLTIPVDKDERELAALEHMMDNMMGRARNQPLGSEDVHTAAGKQTWMQRRAYVARKNAARAVPNLIAGWRIPGGADANGQNCTGASAAAAPATPPANAAPATGGDTGDTVLVTEESVPGSCSFVAAMREGAGVPLTDLSDNPSYREIIHAMSIDRFNSGDYALDKIGTAERQEMEKVVLNAIYLMQLRDYYELLERTALTLAVQVSVMTEQVPFVDEGLGSGSGGSSSAPAGGTP